jgi:hypothetical protein
MTTNLWFLDIQNKRYELFGADMQFKPFKFWFKILYSSHVIFLHTWILLFLRILVIYYLLNLN